MKTGFFKVVLAVVQKDIQAEFRSRELSTTMLLFALLSILIFSFALELDRVAQESSVSGVLWVTVVFASILGLNRSMSIERDQGGMDAMLLAPIDRSALFVGKFAANFIFALVIGLLLLPLMTVLFDFNMVSQWMMLVLLLGTFGISTSGTLLAAMTSQTQSRGETLLPIVMLPVILPLLLAAVNATNGIINASPVNEWTVWVQILCVVNVIYFGLCFITFQYVIEE